MALKTQARSPRNPEPGFGRLGRWSRLSVTVTCHRCDGIRHGQPLSWEKGLAVSWEKGLAVLENGQLPRVERRTLAYLLARRLDVLTQLVS